MPDEEYTVVSDNELAELRDNARLWDRVKEIAEYRDQSCAGCPIEKVVECNGACLCMGRVIDALRRSLV
jgi:hypothetical protein